MADVESASFADDPWSPATLWSELAQRPRRRYVVAPGYGPGEPALLGFAGVDLTGEVADVMTVAVHPAARGRGTGGLLLGHLQDQAGAAGARQVLLEVREDNEVARRMYASRGYHVVHTRRGYYRSTDGPAVDALVLRKELVGDE